MALDLNETTKKRPSKIVRKKTSRKQFDVWETPEVSKEAEISPETAKKASESDEANSNSNAYINKQKPKDVSEHKRNTNGTQPTRSKEETEHKHTNQTPLPEEKKELTEHKRATEAEERYTIGTQTEHNKQNTASQVEEKKITVHKEHTNTGKRNTKPDTIGTQTAHNLSFSQLTGHQRALTYFFYNISKLNPNRLTEKITKDYILMNTEIPKGSIKTTVARLKGKGIIQIIEYKDGRGGYCVYRLADYIFNEILVTEANNGTQTEHKQATQRDTEQDTTVPSSSSDINIINTTTKELSEEWEQIQTPPILKSLNFGKNVMLQVMRRELVSAKEYQDSLDCFAFDIEANDLINKKSIRNPVAYFMGIMNRKEPYQPPANYEADEEKAYLENKKRLEELKRKRLERENILDEIAYEEWVSGLTMDEKIKFAPSLTPDSSLFNEAVRAHFFWELKLKKQEMRKQTH